MIRVLIYNEFIKGSENAKEHETYPDGMHMAIKRGIEDQEISVKTVTFEDVANVITEKTLAETDVLIWWGHIRHDDITDNLARMIQEAVLGGMGAIFLHSSMHSKPFKFLMGTSCNIGWREDDDSEMLWVTDPSHPIAQGIGRYIRLPAEETYSEPFAIPEPDKTVFIASFEGGEVFRAGCCWQRENGKIFYFQPGHESVPTYLNSDILRVIKNAVHWAKPTYRKKIDCIHIKKIEY